MRPLVEVTWKFGVSCLQCANETQHYVSFHPFVDAIPCLECCLFVVLEWMGAIKLKLNLDKTAVLWVRPPAVCRLAAPPLMGGRVFSLLRMRFTAQHPSGLKLSMDVLLTDEHYSRYKGLMYCCSTMPLTILFKKNP